MMTVNPYAKKKKDEATARDAAAAAPPDAAAALATAAGSIVSSANKENMGRQSQTRATNSRKMKRRPEHQEHYRARKKPRAELPPVDLSKVDTSQKTLFGERAFVQVIDCVTCRKKAAGIEWKKKHNELCPRNKITKGGQQSMASYSFSKFEKKMKKVNNVRPKFQAVKTAESMTGFFVPKLTKRGPKLGKTSKNEDQPDDIVELSSDEEDDEEDDELEEQPVQRSISEPGELLLPVVQQAMSDPEFLEGFSKAKKLPLFHSPPLQDRSSKTVRLQGHGFPTTPWNSLSLSTDKRDKLWTPTTTQ